MTGMMDCRFRITGTFWPEGFSKLLHTCSSSF